MHVIAPRQAWTDDRLDDLNQKVDDGFAKLEARFDKLIFALFTVGGGIIVALIGLLGTAVF